MSLKTIRMDWDRVENKEVYPFCVPAIARMGTLELDRPVTFIVGENGTGKSTLLEAIAYQRGFGLGGGDKNTKIEFSDESALLSSALILSWMPKITSGFFLRAETFFDFARHLDEQSRDPYAGGSMVYQAYGGKSLNEQSHGEAFLSLFLHRFRGKSLFLLDEPEAALSPQRQLAFLNIIHELTQEGGAQFLIATHSPVLMAYPGARIYQCDEEGFHRTRYEDTEHYRFTKSFLEAPDRFFRHLFQE